jgi:rRNA-processing protein FCF1
MTPGRTYLCEIDRDVVGLLRVFDFLVVTEDEDLGQNLWRYEIDVGNLTGRRRIVCVASGVNLS